MRIAICDDELMEQNNTKKQLETAYKSLDLLVDVYSSGRELLRVYEENKYNLIFLDIEMPDMDGITLAQKIRKSDKKVAICFLTSHVEYALKGYEVNALRYLTKPVRIEQLSEIIAYLIEQHSKEKKIMLKHLDNIELVSINEILYFEAQNQNIRIITAKKEYSRRYNIRDYEEELMEYSFIRTHRSFLVNMAHVIRISKNEVVLDNNESIPLSRTKEKAVKEALFAFVKGSAI